MRNLFSFLIFFSLAFFSSINAQTIEVYASTDNSEYVVGDYINYKLELNYDNRITVEIPSVKDSLKELDFIKELPPIKEESDSKIVEIHKFVFSKYDSSDVTIPSFTIYYRVDSDTLQRAIQTNELMISVRTLEVNLSAEIQDVKAPIKIPLDWLFIFILVLIIAIILGGAYYGYRYYKRKKAGILSEKIVIKIPPHKVALSALYQLEEKKLWQQGKVKEYHSEITGIIRKYFEDRFNFLALEMPSSEVLDILKEKRESQQIFDTTREFLSNADLVKFAKFQPMPSVNEEMMKQGYEIVKKTKPEEMAEQPQEVVNAA